MEATENGVTQVEEKKYLDEESRKLVKFFSGFNVVLLIFALIGTFWLGYNQAESVQQAKMYSSEIWSDYEDDYTSIYDDDYEDDYENSYSSNAIPEIDALTFAMILVIGTGYSILQFNLIKLMVKHFENTAELKSIQKEALERSR